MVFFSSCRDFIPTVRIMYFKFTMKFSRLIKKSSLSDVAKQNWKAWQVLFKVVQLKVHTQIAFSLSHSDAGDIWWLRVIKCLPDILCPVGVLYFLLLHYIISKSFCQPFAEKIPWFLNELNTYEYFKVYIGFYKVKRLLKIYSATFLF